ncbi:acylphosphatase [Krasilnikoviella flava]|uniref:acylphosphatase n=1 Tax=Krasilnikoviella flava TaxID=526729 RepID=A0A1T5L4V1_9MICO|nr:acylphosphatase [Krasilnikoviella flava]SKC70964.1 acylphosphatase [Krasilnikoviella flava]
MATTVRRRVRVHGHVQGVGFRWATREAAARLGVVGAVRNLRDGTVEAEVEGGPDAVDAMLAFLREGPPAALVSAVDVEEVSPRGDTAFVVSG